MTKPMKRLTLLLCLVLMLAAFGFPYAQAEGDKAPLFLRVYLFDPCGGCASADTGCRECEVIMDVLNRLIRLLGDELASGQVDIRMRNLLFEPVQKEHQTYLKAFGQEDTPKSHTPTYLLGEPGWGALVHGEENESALPGLISEVIARMPADAAWRREPREGQEFIAPRSDPLTDIQPSDSLILYFFKDFCPYCKDLEVLFDALPDFVYLADGTKSRVRFVSLEKQIPAHMKVVQRYYDKLFVHPDRQFVPMVVIGDKALFLQAEIVPGLFPALISGEGLKTNREPLEALHQ
ncbi:MAG: hypothetical protein GXZ04_04295 [Clostridiales bacterium]|nr:hypothetical protein [Clostridiales bacterium]